MVAPGRKDESAQLERARRLEPSAKIVDMGAQEETDRRSEGLPAAAVGDEER
jgi:hypothetical protein